MKKRGTEKSYRAGCVAVEVGIPNKRVQITIGYTLLHRSNAKGFKSDSGRFIQTQLKLIIAEHWSA